MEFLRQDYLHQLILRSKENLNQFYNFSAYSNFDFVNSFLVETALKTDKTNLLITTPNKDRLNQFFLPAILIATLHCLKANQNIINCLQEEDIILCKKDGKVSKVKKILENQIQILPLNKSKRILVEDYTIYVCFQEKVRKKVNEILHRDTLLQRKKGIVNFEKNMFDAFKVYESMLSHFHSIDICLPIKHKIKTIIVASKNEMLNQIPNCIPFQYMNKSGETYPDTPFDPLLVVVNDFKTVKEHFIEKEIPVDTIIFIGDNKYRQSLSAISKNFRQEKFNHCIFIGTEDIETGENFEVLKWNWTLPEIKFFDKQKYQNLTTETLLQPELSAETLNFTDFITQTEHRYDNLINLKNLFKFIRKVYPITALNNEVRIRDRANEIYQDFLSEAKELFQVEYYNIDKNYTDDFEKLKSIYDNIINLIKNSNAKATWFKTATNIDFIVVPKSIKDFWGKELSSCFNSQQRVARVNNLQNISELFNQPKPELNSVYIGLKETKAITLKEFSNKEPDGQTHLFLSLYSNGVYPDMLLQKILSSNLQTKILCYDEEAKALQIYQQSFQRNDEIELRSSSREKLCGLSYPETANINNENIDEWIKYLIEFDDLKFSRTEEHKFEITFEDETKTIERESKSVYVDEYEEHYKEVKHLKKGERVRIYQNPDKETLHDIIKMTDEKELFTRVDNFSSLWKNALKEYFQRIVADYNEKNLELLDFDSNSNNQEPLKGPIEQLFEILQTNGLSVEKHRLESWMKQDSKTKFPMRKRDLLAIIKTVNHAELNNKIRTMFALKTEYSGRIIKAGFEFSEEINSYILTGEKGKMLTWLSEKHIQEIISVGAPMRTIIDIKKLDEELID